jgi:YppF-like protein
MLVENLIIDFKTKKNCSPLHANDLLDFIQYKYISGELSICEYKQLFFELDKLEAEKPHFFIMNIKQGNFSRVERPS